MSRKQTGFVLPAAIFLLVVLGALAAYLTNVTRINLAMNNLELEGERAYWAAQAGAEAGIYQAAVLGLCVTQDIALAGELNRFVATVSCSQTNANEGGQPVRLFQITSVACNDPAAASPRCPNGASVSAEYVERQVGAMVEN
ncbi:MSHA biogenesis protein MshP [Sulfuritortus calidifontis]|uniref:MSHA biogenesis protein MshP n=1 Tax=Sulfuritortus calidifontis TaxID=1914471 RepID=A0A4R3JV90_9PROT|nr:agglutinin biogenesis protein MshP [Sulfuritortus calidifontis]TCS71890.1 MSHA biogenesis protein MshP [Sulfuritortus calidifontis]